MHDTEPMKPFEATFTTRNRYKKLEYDWSQRSRRELKPICFKCVTNDFTQGNQKEFDDYELKNPFKTDDIYHHKDNTKKVGKNYEYLCPKGHKTTFYTNLDEAALVEKRQTK